MKLYSRVEIKDGDYAGAQGYVSSVIYGQWVVTFSTGDSKVFFRSQLKLI